MRHGGKNEAKRAALCPALTRGLMLFIPGTCCPLLCMDGGHLIPLQCVGCHLECAGSYYRAAGSGRAPLMYPPTKRAGGRHDTRLWERRMRARNNEHVISSADIIQTDHSGHIQSCAAVTAASLLALRRQWSPTCVRLCIHCI